MKKKYNFQLLAIMMVALLSVVSMSCSKESVESDNKENTEMVSDQDPEGTIVLNMTSGTKDNYYKIGELGEIHIDAANNFSGKNNNTSFVSVGLIGGLGEIIQIPKSGWAESAAVVPGTGYLMRYGYSSSYQYARIYVVDYLGSTYTDESGNTYGEITGATIKYQAPFLLPIKLDVTSLSFDSGTNSKTLELANPTTISIEEKPDWCEVYINTESKITITVTENLTAEQRQGDIVLKNDFNSVKINIMQKGASLPMFQAGSGTVDDPYQIKTAQQLKSITRALNAHYILTADIILNEEVNGSGWDPIGKQETPFVGKIDGQGHYIKNMWMKRPTTDGVGLFGYIQNAVITGICLEIETNGINGGRYVGGICGYSNYGEIHKCSVNGVISGKDNVAGICGEAPNTKIYQCYTEGTMKSELCVSGITNSAIVFNCFSTMSLIGNQVNGIGGNNVTQCYYAGKASPSYRYSSNNSKYYDFYCSGTYTYYDSSVLSVLAYDSQTTKNARRTSQMKTQSNYEGWDFTDTWEITEGKTYPVLRCFDKEQQEKSQWGNISENYYLVGGSGCWCSSKEQKFLHSSKSVYEDPIFTYTFESNGTDMWFAFGDDEAIDAIDMGVWNKLYGTTGASEDLNGTFDRRYNLSGDNSFHVDGKANYYRLEINIANQTYTISELNSL